MTEFVQYLVGGLATGSVYGLIALGFVGAWSQPIKSARGDVLGTFGTYFRESRTPTPAEREGVALLAGVAAEAIAEAA